MNFIKFLKSCIEFVGVIFLVVNMWIDVSVCLLIFYGEVSSGLE